MGWNWQRLSLLPKCREVCRQYTETYPQFWARRLVWAYDSLKQTKESIYWSDLRKLSGVKKERALKCIDKLADMEKCNDRNEIIRLIIG